MFENTIFHLIIDHKKKEKEKKCFKSNFKIKYFILGQKKDFWLDWKQSVWFLLFYTPWTILFWLNLNSNLFLII